jgi:hypothetical protein
MTSVEMTEERPPVQWWPTESDLTAIRAVPYNEALVLAKRWPSSAVLSAGTYAGPPVSLTGAAGADSTATSAIFTDPPGQAP